MDGNAIRLAKTPRLAKIYGGSSWTLIGASGNDVGLPDGQMGNSEVGHLNLGAGRIVYQDIVRIDRGVKDGTFYSNKVIVDTIDAAKRSGGTLHLFGLTSPGNVHAALEHAYAVCETAKRRGFDRVMWHAFLDGRDTPPRSAAGYLRDVDAQLKKIGVGKLASAVGRYYAMDRDKRWDRLEVAWKMLTRGEGKVVDDLAAAVEAAYSGANNADGKDLTDEFVKPLVMRGPDGKALATIRDGDACFFWNFRADRARQLTLALHAPEFPHFDRTPRPRLAAFATMTQYDAKLEVPAAFPPQSLDMILGEVLSKAGVSQLRTAETEKYAHVTYFFNGGVEAAFPGEERKLVPSNRQVATYDLAPEMSAVPVTDGVVSALQQSTDAGGPQFILVNYANPDMVGHTGKLEPAIEAVEAVDHGVGAIVAAARDMGGAVIITADHGNCEMMKDPVTGGPHTAHTTNPVPLFFVDEHNRGARLRSGAASATWRRRSSNTSASSSPRRWTGSAYSRGQPGEHRPAAHRPGARRAEFTARPRGPRGRRRRVRVTDRSHERQGARGGARAAAPGPARGGARRARNAGRAHRRALARSPRCAQQHQQQRLGQPAPPRISPRQRRRQRGRAPRLRRAGGATRLRLRDRAPRVPHADAQVPPGSAHLDAGKTESGERDCAEAHRFVQAAGKAPAPVATGLRPRTSDLRKI